MHSPCMYSPACSRRGGSGFEYGGSGGFGGFGGVDPMGAEGYANAGAGFMGAEPGTTPSTYTILQ
jgi:hypothetical protein